MVLFVSVRVRFGTILLLSVCDAFKSSRVVLFVNVRFARTPSREAVALVIFRISRVVVSDICSFVIFEGMFEALSVRTMATETLGDNVLFAKLVLFDRLLECSGVCEMFKSPRVVLLVRVRFTLAPSREAVALAILRTEETVALVTF